MNRLLLIVILTLSLQSLTKAHDIEDFQIDGISVGDSLLDFVSEKYIINEINDNAPNYKSFNPKDKFGEIYIDSKKGKYSTLSFFVKIYDPKYKIYMLRGIMSFNDSLDECLKQKTDTTRDLASIFLNIETMDDKFTSDLDPTGRSIFYNTSFSLHGKDEVTVNCSDWEESLRIENNWINGLSVILQKKEFIKWIQRNYRLDRRTHKPEVSGSIPFIQSLIQHF